VIAGQCYTIPLCPTYAYTFVDDRIRVSIQQYGRVRFSFALGK
jgi:hypothetical protein